MNLADRTRAVTGAYAGDHGLRRAAAAVGLAVVSVGLGRRSPAVTVVGGFMLGWALNPDPDRAYLEGFTDGLRIEPATAAGPAEGQPDGAGTGLRAVPGGARDEVAGRVAGRIDPDQRAARTAVQSVPEPTVVLGIPIEPRRPRHPVDDDGSIVGFPAGPTLDGPRATSLPVPAARAVRAPARRREAAGPAAGRKTGRRTDAP